MRNDHSTEDITMFERNAGLLVKLRDIAAALSDCVLSEELISALQQLQVVTILYRQLSRQWHVRIYGFGHSYEQPHHNTSLIIVYSLIMIISSNVKLDESICGVVFSEIRCILSLDEFNHI